MLVVRLAAEIEARLEALAKRIGGCSKFFYAGQASLEHLEDLEDVRLADEARSEHFASGGATVSMDEVMERYGS